MPATGMTRVSRFDDSCWSHARDVGVPSPWCQQLERVGASLTATGVSGVSALATRVGMVKNQLPR